MNIIIIEDSAKSGFGGGQRVTLDVIKELMKDNLLYVFDTDTMSVFNRNVQDLNIETIQLKSFGKSSKSNWYKFLEKIINMTLLFHNMSLIGDFIASKSAENKFLVYVTTKKGLLLAYLLKVFFKLDFIYHAHLIEPKATLIVVRFLTKRAFKVITVSPLVSEQFVRDNVEEIYNSINIVKKNHKTISNKDNYIIASISSLNYIKGIEYFIDSFDYLTHKNITYNIYGDGPLAKVLKKNTNTNINIKGFLTNVEEVLVNEVDILVVPTIIPESFGLVILEAFACGVPVITTNIGMQKVLVQESKAGKVVDIKDSRGIAKMIDYILFDDVMYQSLSKNALDYFNKFDKDVFNKKIIEIFKKYKTH